MGNPVLGLRPMADAKGQVNTRMVPVSASNTIALSIGSAVYLSAGQALGTPAYSNGAESVTGSVVRCMTDGNKTVQNIPASTDGYMVELSIDPDQRYEITCNDAGVEVGKFYSLTNETITANANGFDGGACSKRQLAVATEDTSGEQFIVAEFAGGVDNVPGTAGAAAIVTINPVNYVAG